jgi:type I restriction enzyme S subunit
MNNIKPYTKYKPSGIAWLGDIPEHWELRKLKYSLQINNGADYKHIQSDSGYPVIGSGGQFTCCA